MVTDERYFPGAFLTFEDGIPPEEVREPVEYFWFPWCTSSYQTEWAQRKVAELQATGRYWNVRAVCTGSAYADDGLQTYSRIDIRLARDQLGATIWDKREVEPRAKHTIIYQDLPYKQCLDLLPLIFPTMGRGIAVLGDPPSGRGHVEITVYQGADDVWRIQDGTPLNQVRFDLFPCGNTRRS